MSMTPPPRTIVFFGLTERTHAITDGILSFIEAGFVNIALIGLKPSNLELLANAIKHEASQNAGLAVPNILVQEVDIGATESIGLTSHNVRSNLGAWDVFVNCLALTPKSVSRTTIRGTDEDDWWEPFERNVRTLHAIARHFFPKKTAGAIFFQIVSVDIDGIGEEKNSAENASQLAAARVVVHLGKENTADGFQAINARMNDDETLLYRKFETLLAARDTPGS